MESDRASSPLRARHAPGPQFTTGALVASLAAGPMAMAPIVVAGLVSNPDHWAGLAIVPLVLIPALLFGFAIALIPNFVGAALLVAAGNRNPVFRRRAVWALVGFLFGAAIAAAILADPLTFEGAILGTIGSICALISRHFVGWGDGG